MKGAKSSQTKEKRSAENWVDIARTFGEKCVAIQHDSKLDIEQKLEKQKSLAKEMAKDIQEDPYLTVEDKRIMINSIKDYIDDWTKMHDILKQGSEEGMTEKPKKKQKK
jgi:hypothetical protein